MNFNKCIWALNIELSEHSTVLLTVIYKYTTTVWYKHYNQDEGRSHDKGRGHDEGCGQDEGHDHDGGVVMKLPTVHTHYHTHTHTHTLPCKLLPYGTLGWYFIITSFTIQTNVKC